MLLLQLSIRYWRKHKKRLLTLAAVIIMGASALCLVALFIRSEKSFILDQTLDHLGNYDAIFYELEQKDIGLISQHEKVSASGYYRELGYAGINESSVYKVISFPDDQSIELYHMSCTKGNYPTAENEIAMDANTAKELGIAPVPGQKLQLTLFDLEKKELTAESFLLSGIFEASDAEVWGGFHRYPGTTASSPESYEVPVIFVSDAKSEEFASSLVTVFFQSDGEITALAMEIAGADFSKLGGWNDTFGRHNAYSYILGVAEHFMAEYNELTIDSLLRAIKEGNVWKDFYSSVVMPLFGILIFIIITGSVFSLVRNLLLDRSEQIAILRSLGMEKGRTFLFLFLELLILISFFAGLGLAIGSGIHYLLIRGMNHIYDVNIPLGIGVSDYVASVTVSPWAYPILVLEISSILAILPPLLQMVKAAPITVFEKRFVRQKRRKQRHLSDFSRCSYRKLIGKHIKFHDAFVLIITCVVMSSCFLGYNYFRAFAEFNNTEYEYSLAESGLGEWDFAASKTEMSMPYEFMIENRHDEGINEKAYQSFAKNPWISESFARIVNQSTRLSYPKNRENPLPEYLSLRKNPASADSYENALYEAENAMIQQIGYTTEEEIYALPSIGITETEWKDLSPYVKEGAINLEKIGKGEEVVLLVSAGMEQSILNHFHVGEYLPLSDIVLSEAEESYPFGQFIPSDYKEPAYQKTIKEPEYGNTVELASYAFGKRKDIQTKIGAIIVLTDQKVLKRYAIPYQNIFDGEIPDIEIKTETEDEEEDNTLYTLSLLCLPETFRSWQLPDELFTEVEFALRENADVTKANASWYEILGDCNGITFRSSYEIKEKMQTNTRNTMLIYYLMLFVLIFMGIMASGIKFYSAIKLRSQTIAKLRALGMPLSGLERMIVEQNIIYPIIGTLVSLIPVSICQMFFLYIKRQIDSGAWDGISAGELPWYINIPFRYDLFSYHPVLVLALLLGAFLILILFATIPQIIYIRKQSIAETMEEDSF